MIIISISFNLLLLLATPSTANTSGFFTEYSISSGHHPFRIITGPDGNLWYTAGETIGKISTTGSITEYPIPTPHSNPHSIAVGSDGNLWFTEDQKIGKITTTGFVTEYSLPQTNSHAWGVTAGPDGNLWYADHGGNRIGKITTTGSITEYPLPSLPTTGNPAEITVGPDGNLWFTEITSHRIGKITTSGSITEYSGGTGMPQGITTGPDGNIWFAESGSVGKITPSGLVTNYSVPTISAGITAITAGPDGNLWFSETIGHKIGKITISGTVTEYAVPTLACQPAGITSGPDGDIWFAEEIGKIGRYHIASSTTFYFAEGTCRPGFDPYFCIQNPGTTPADVTLTYMKGDGTTATDQVTIPANSRSTVVPRNKLGTGDDPAHDFSTVVSCTNNQQIIAERPMYFNYSGGHNYNWNGGHDVVGF